MSKEAPKIQRELRRRYTVVHCDGCDWERDGDPESTWREARAHIRSTGHPLRVSVERMEVWTPP